MKTLLTFLLLFAVVSFAQETPKQEKTKSTRNKLKVKTVPKAVEIEEFVSVDVEPYPIGNIQSNVVYPAEAKAKKLEGRVIVSCLIDTNGRVVKTLIEKTDDHIFDNAAQDAVKATRFTPARSNDIPVKVWYTVPVIFRLPK